MTDEGPVPAPGPTGLPTGMEAKKVFDRLKRTGASVAAKYRSIAEVNESFYGGDQWSVLVADKGRVTINKNAWWDSEKVPRLAVNLYTGLLMTWSALLTSDSPIVKAVAASDEPMDTYRSAFAQKIIEYIENEVDSRGKIHDAVQLAGLGGIGGLKIVYLGAEDRIAWEAISVHDVLLDPNSQDWRDAGWVIFEDHISQEEAAELLGVDDEIPEEPYKNAANEELHGVERHELWMRPTRKYPRGLYACFVAGEPVEITEYPYVVADDSGVEQFLLPLALMTVRKQRGSVYGNTNFTDAVPLQRALNENVSRVQKILRTTSNIHLVMPEALATNFNPAESTLIAFPSSEAGINGAKAITYTKPPEINPALFSQRDYLAQMMEQVVGLNAATAGTQTRSMSGRAIEHLVELDANRNADATRSMQTMVEEAMRLSLALIGLYYTEPRQAKITNGDAADVLAFSAADVQGVDIRLEPASEIDDLSASKEARALERMGQGAAGPGELAQAQNAPSYGTSRAIVEQMLQAFLAGQPLGEVPGDLNFDAADEVVAKHRARALATQDMGLWIAVERFKRELEAMRQRADALSPPTPEGPPPGPPAPEAPDAPRIPQPTPPGVF